MDLNNQDIGCSPQPDSKDVLLKTTPDSSLMTEKPIWCLPRTFTLLTSVHSTRSALCTQSEAKGKAGPATNSGVMMVTCLHDTLVQQWYKSRENTQPH